MTYVGTLTEPAEEIAGFLAARQVGAAGGPGRKMTWTMHWLS
jgi:hypothetical protein